MLTDTGEGAAIDDRRLSSHVALAVRRTEVDVAERFVDELALGLAEVPDDLFARLARAETRRDRGLD